MKLFVTSAYPEHNCLDRLVELAALDSHGRHKLVFEPELADAILFVENTQFDDLQFKSVLNHPLVAAFPDKVFMYNEMDRSWPVLPGLYCSLTEKFSKPEDHLAFPYLTSSNAGIQHIHESTVERRWLYSFVGSSSHPIRKQLFDLKSDCSKIVDTSDFCAWDPLQTSAHAFQKLYWETMAASKFVLCPRGIGPSSLRLYETIEAGRIPVIISDNWVPPPQINWDFAVRIPESRIATIPDVLKAIEPEWQERSGSARSAWARAYAPDQMFNTVGNGLEQLSQTAAMQRTGLAVEMHKFKVLVKQGLRQKFKGHSAPGKSLLGGRHSAATAARAQVGEFYSEKV